MSGSTNRRFHAKCIGLVKEKDPGQDQDQEEEIEVPEVFSCESCNAILAKHEADQQLAESDVGAEKKRKSSPPAVTVVVRGLELSRRKKQSRSWVRPRPTS